MTGINKLITDNIDVWTNAVQKKVATGRGVSKKTKLIGIGRLRELILELAVRGKLTEQLPTDGLIEELILDIEEEKKEFRLTHKNKIKVDALPENIADRETPKGWKWIRLGSLFNSIQSGGTPSKRNELFWGGDIPWASVKDYGAQKVILDTQDYITSEGLEAGSKLAKKGDILICTRMGLGKIAVAGKDLAFNQDLKAVKLSSKVPVDFFINTYSTIKIKGTGTTVAGIKQEQLLNYLICLPPEEEQKRIVAKVDELMALCDQLEQQTEASIDAHQLLVEELLSTLFLPAEGSNSENAQDLTAKDDGNEGIAGANSFEQNWARIAEHFDLLFTTEHSIEQLKQTILQLAVMGKLVPQDPTDEPASKLLKRIAQEKEQLIKDKVIKKQKPLPDITGEEKAFDLPCGWEWAKLDYLALKSGAGWSPQCNGHPKVGDNWGVLKVSAISWGEYNPDENKELPVSLEPRPELEVKSGDFLISRANTAELVAKAVVVPENSPGRLMMSDKIIRFNFSPLISLDYIKLINNSRQSRTYYAAVAGGTSSSMKNVSREQIRNLVFAIPSTNEQLRIVAKFNELLAICEQLKASITDAKATQVHLAEAIVEQALN